MSERQDKKSPSIGILGGDLRLIYAALELHNLGFPISIFGNSAKLYSLTDEESQPFSTQIPVVHEFKEFMCNHNILLCPTPFSKNGESISMHPNLPTLTLDDFFHELTPQHQIYGGAISPSLMTRFQRKGMTPYDFMKQEEVAIGNAIATAEGTIVEAIKSSSQNLHASNSLVLGFGRCAKILCSKLKGMDANVTVAARRAEALAYAQAYGYQALPLELIHSTLKKYDFIFNTIPSMVLTKEHLASTKYNVTIIDIASAPGGVDFDAAKLLHRNARLCLALPGIYSPKSSAHILVQTLLNQRNIH